MSKLVTMVVEATGCGGRAAILTLLGAAVALTVCMSNVPTVLAQRRLPPVTKEILPSKQNKCEAPKKAQSKEKKEDQSKDRKKGQDKDQEQGEDKDKDEDKDDVQDNGAESPVFDCPPLPDCRPQSYFQRSLGRYGLIAPFNTAMVSLHSCIGRPMPLRPSPCPPHIPPGVMLSQLDEEQLHRPPCTGPCTEITPYSNDDFSSDPNYDHVPYDVCCEQGVYGGKYAVPVQRPLIELGLPFYRNGPIPPSQNLFGITNPDQPKFYLYGDYRAAVAYNQANTDKGVLANRINLEWDLWFTATERLHMFTGPFQNGGSFMRLECDDGDLKFFDELNLWNPDTDTLFFEGDLGAMAGGYLGMYAPVDLPIAVGLIPLLFQNGVWMEDAFVGAAMTIPARNSRLMDWSNFDITFFAGFDQVTSPAFGNSTSAAQLFGATTFIEAKGGYFEIGYAFLNDTTDAAHSYHNLGLSYTRRYLNLVSNSVRLIGNVGQSGPQNTRTADGALVIMENSFLTPWPYNVIPYVNLFAGFDRPQSAARAAAAGGVLRNEGILFESDNLTGYPTLDATANDTCGAAIGIDLLTPQFDQQLILETAIVQAFGNPVGRNARGDQYGIGMRYQIPISNAHLLRFDAMHGWLKGANDVTGGRAEFRWKF